MLHARQSTVTVTPADISGNSSSGTNLSGGAIAGIVIGSIAGFLLLLWIFKSCSNIGAPPQEKREPAWYDDDVGGGSRRTRGRSRHNSRRGSYYVHDAHAPRRSRSREVRTVHPAVYTSEPRRPSRAHEKHHRRGGPGARAGATTGDGATLI